MVVFCCCGHILRTFRFFFCQVDERADFETIKKRYRQLGMLIIYVDFICPSDYLAGLQVRQHVKLNFKYTVSIGHALVSTKSVLRTCRILFTALPA